jgi:hypothetical protein
MDTITSGCNDADSLAGYLIREGATLKPETLAAVAKAQAEAAAGKLSDQTKIDFYLAYSELAKLAAPVTAESLRACSEDCATDWKRWWWSDPKPVPLSERAVLKHHTWAAIALGTLLVVQVYWLIGSTLLSGLQDVSPPKPPPASTPHNQASPTPAPAASGQSMPTPSATKTAEDTEMDQEKAEMAKGAEQSRVSTHVWFLSVWSSVWRWLPDLYRPGPPKKEPTANSADSAPPPETGGTKSNRQWELVIGTRFVLDILQTYVLPLLYGWVGSMAFVVRSLIAAIKNRTFRVELNTEYRLRVYLGLLAGLMIGWFLKPKAGSAQFGVADLTPAAIAFLAGYSVEILFSTMDRLVSGFVTAFGGSSIETPQKTRS